MATASDKSGPLCYIQSIRSSSLSSPWQVSVSTKDRQTRNNFELVALDRAFVHTQMETAAPRRQLSVVRHQMAAQSNTTTYGSALPPPPGCMQTKACIAKVRIAHVRQQKY